MTQQHKNSEHGVVRKNAVIKIKNGSTLYTVIVEEELTVEWNMGSAGICQFNLIKQPGLNISEGNAVLIYFRTGGDNEDEDKPWFIGYIFTISRSDDDILSITAYDQLRYLKYKDTKQFTDTTLSDRVVEICSDRGIPVGEIDETELKLPDHVFEDKEYLDMFRESQDEHMRNTEEIYVLYDYAGYMNCKNLKNMKIEDYNWGRHNTETFDLESSIDQGVYNIVKIDRTNDQGQVMESIVESNDELVARWGMLQFYAKDNTGRDLNALAKLALSLVSKKTRKLRLNDCIGDTRVRAGSALGIVMPNMGDIDIKGWMIVSNVTHKVGNCTHLMDLDLINDDFMDNPDISGMFESQNRQQQSGAGGVGGAGGFVEGDTNEIRIWNFFRGKGFSPEATAAIIGNFFQESRLEPGIHQIGGGPGRGLAQWEASYSGGSGRWDKLVAWANANGKDPYALETQCEWVLEELKDPYFAQFLSDFPGMTDVDAATIKFSKYYEGAGIPNDANRLKVARDVLNRLLPLERVGGGFGQNLGLSGPQVRQSIANYAQSLLNQGIKYSQTYRPGDPDLPNIQGHHDCSSFVRHVYKHVTGHDIGYNTVPQSGNGQHIPVSQMNVGDLLFNGSGGGNAGHVMIYLGNNQVIHCTSGDGRPAVRIDNVNNVLYSHAVRWIKD